MSAVTETLTKHHTARRALLYLLTTRPNEVVTKADVCEALGFEVTAQAVSNAAGLLRSGDLGLAITSRGGSRGGYVLLVPVPARGAKRCANCRSRSRRGTCSVLRDQSTGLNDWCGGWS